ncbi:hypothetical protein ON006_13940 [Dyadobacter pollutisoli]|uniref:Uncharacterized protein n=1 Tax=Dyadobacter pollutisoli TaxID=2910158 RepID=A0A9E8NFL4_9BACT|nr:hypothetical protein [Dyadobacter pollutisoli]WAC15038.1 hypothetical protein ON006_13940 [Dyadobacter pollutisoli]
MSLFYEYFHYYLLRMKLAGAYAPSGKLNCPPLTAIAFPVTSPRRFTGIAAV